MPNNGKNFGKALAIIPGTTLRVEVPLPVLVDGMPNRPAEYGKHNTPSARRSNSPRWEPQRWAGRFGI
eukprot:8171482-Lingulodinium_polyedra.AAC.1